MPRGNRRYLNLSPLEIWNEKLFAEKVTAIQAATGLSPRDLWEFREHATRVGNSRGGLFVWMIWNAEEAREFVSLADEDAAREHVKEWEAEHG